MSWGRVARRWTQFRDSARQQWRRPTEGELEAAADRMASGTQLAEWAAARHEIDPIHK
jgi:hypothetical protein